MHAWTQRRCSDRYSYFLGSVMCILAFRISECKLVPFVGYVSEMNVVFEELIKYGTINAFQMTILVWVNWRLGIVATFIASGQ